MENTSKMDREKMRIKKFLILNSSFLICFLASFLIPSAAFAAMGTSATTTTSISSLTGAGSGLVGWWTMDGKDTNWGTYTMIDRSGNGNTGSLVGLTKATSTAIGKIGQALKYDGSKTRINIPRKSILEPTNYLTISAWVYVTKSADNTIISRKTWDGDNFGYFFRVQANNAIYLGINNAFTAAVSETAIPNNKWVFVTAVYNNGIVKLYTNAVSLNTTGGVVAPITYGTAQNVFIGSAGDAVAYQFNGLIDDVRLYNRALSPGEIQQLYNQSVTKFGVSAVVATSTSPGLQTANSLNQGLVGYWTMDGKDINWTSAYTGTMIDRSGKGNTGTFINMGLATSTVIGKIGQAAKFSGPTDVISMGSLTVPAQPTTICAWIYLTGWGGASLGRIFDSTNLHFFMNGAGSSGNLLFQAPNAGPISATIYTKKWQYVCASRDASNLANFYVNGVISGTPNQSTGTALSSSGFFIGNNSATGGVRALQGLIDDVRVYNRALLPGEIQQLYNQSVTKFASSATVATSTSAGAQAANSLNQGLVGYWTMDGKDINWTTNKIIDRSGNGNTGSLIGLTVATSTAIGKIGQALNFATSSPPTSYNPNYIANSGFVLTSPSVTLSAWANLKTNTLNTQVYSMIDVSWGHAQIALNGQSPTNIKFDIQDTSGFKECQLASGGVLTNKWHLYTGTYDDVSKYWAIYVDGKLLGTCSHPLASAITNQSYLTIGAQYHGSGGSWFIGPIDDARIYNRALSPTEVLQLYNQGR